MTNVDVSKILSEEIETGLLHPLVFPWVQACYPTEIHTNDKHHGSTPRRCTHTLSFSLPSLLYAEAEGEGLV